MLSAKCFGCHVTIISKTVQIFHIFHPLLVFLLFLYQNNNMAILKNIKKFPSIDIRDVLFFGGIFMLGYGMFLWKGLWLALITCGSLFTVIGYLMTDKNKVQ